MTKDEFQVAWARRARVGRRIGLFAGLAIVVGLLLVSTSGAFAAPSAQVTVVRWQLLMGAGLVASALLMGPLSALNARCPSCGAFLGKVMWARTSCPRCRAGT